MEIITNILLLLALFLFGLPYFVKGRFAMASNENSKRHGSSFDRGRADSWYGRGRNPHYYVGGTYMSDLVEEKDMTESEVKSYNDGYDENEACGCFKDWGE